MTSSALDIAALDCEMIYTTGGFRIARVSVVDASGKEVFDELIKMDDGVEVVCVISPYPRFSSECTFGSFNGHPGT
jgi:RNA exonuclease 1